VAERVRSYRYGEGETREGQVVQFTAPSDEFELARGALQHFRDIRLPSSAVVNVEHGGYGRYSRYEIEQVDYGGGQNEAGGGYYEILNIKNAPEGRHPIVSRGYMSSGEWLSQFFAEWESVEAAKAHWEKSGRGSIITLRTFQEQENEKIKGLIRVVNTGYLSPWFYATGDASLVGDYVFPERLVQDPTFTFGRQFLVPEQSKNSEVILHKLKTCMGCAIEERRDRSGYRYYRSEEPEGVKKYRVVQWHDGSVTEVYPSTPAEKLPVPLAEDDTWVTEAQRRFSEMLSGMNLGFEIKFANGGKFVGKYVPPAEAPKPTAAGDYYATVTLDNGEAIEGWVNGFTPTEEEPNIASHVEKRLAKNGKNAVRIETTSKRTKKGGKKWAGVYHGSLSATPHEALGLDI
jgi:hypothetical protein